MSQKVMKQIKRDNLHNRREKIREEMAKNRRDKWKRNNMIVD